MLAGPIYTDIPIPPSSLQTAGSKMQAIQQAKAQGRPHLTSPQQVSPSFTVMCNLIPSSPAIGVDTTTHVDTVQLSHKSYNCNNTSHFTALCRKPCMARGPVTTPFLSREPRGRSPRSTSRSKRRSSSR